MSKPKQLKQRFHLEEKIVRRFDPPERGSKVFYDDIVPGFGLRVTKNGVRSWILNYYAPDGRERRLTVGRWPVWSAGAAREQVKALRRRIDVGEDPLAESQAKRSGDTFGDLASEYLEVYAARKRDGGASDRRFLDADVLPLWGRLKIRDVGRADVIRLVERKAEDAPVSARRLLAVIRKVFAWGVERGLLEVSPCLHVKAPGKESSRDRVLTLDECGVLWREFLPGPGVGAGVVAAVRLILATGQRPGEVAGMAWSEIDVKEKVWTIPAERAKNGRAHRAPLNKTALEILKSLQPGRGEERRAWVFPSPRGDQPIAALALSHAIRRRLNLSKTDGNRLPLARFTPHDLRRTAASQMAALGVQRTVIGEVLNHTAAGVTAQVYDRYAYLKEMRAALDLWDRALRRAFGKGERAAVVEFRR